MDELLLSVLDASVLCVDAGFFFFFFRRIFPHELSPSLKKKKKIRKGCVRVVARGLCGWL